MKQHAQRASRGRRLAIITSALTLAAGLHAVNLAWADHDPMSLPGSNFELDTNFKVDDPAPSIDWANITETRKSDLVTGKDDDSYAGGTKEDDACPGTTTGSIPNNKSDLLTFGAYVEPEAGGAGWLHMFWTRVLEPSGTTLMDFELNKSSTLCANGVNPVRSMGDLLIEYRLESGGSVATLKKREWSGSAWGAAQDLTSTQAVGTTNTSTIPAAESGGVATSPLSARTFGEASLDLDFILNPNKCESFGSAFLKSRSSDSFTSQMKDFITPIPVNIQNCGKVIIRKETVPDETANTTVFGFTKAFGTDPAIANTFTLKDDGDKTFDNVLFGEGYTVVEDQSPAGWTFDHVDCSASSGGATPTTDQATRKVTFDIVSAANVIDCTYYNRRLLGAIKVTKTAKHKYITATTPKHLGATFTVLQNGEPTGKTIVTNDVTGLGCTDGFELGDYTVVETTGPANYALDTDIEQATVSESSCEAGNAFGVSFQNIPLTDITVSVNSLVPGGTASTIECVATGNPPTNIKSDATGVPSGDGVFTLPNLVPGTYTCTVVVDP